MFPATGLENVGAPMLLSPAKPSMRAQVDSMKSMMLERVSNADRVKYALRASPNAHLRKNQTITISIRQRRNSTRDGPNLSITVPVFDLIGQKDS
jgi:hypothetical protein